jgi:saccharopine dehydrogenase-like NADP-dependent oxidoreductase
MGSTTDPGVSSASHALGQHYFDLTEDVPTTKRIRKLAEASKGLMAPQCGLAPGFVGVVAADLASKFEKVRSIRLRVVAMLKASSALVIRNHPVFVVPCKRRRF